jgi:glycosyltransferase involved in cell wall biosynthesis
MLDTSMVSSEHLRDWMTQRGAVTSGLHVVHTNIDADKWSPDPDLRARVRYELGIDTKTALILYPCRMAEQKRPELMCNIIAALRRATKSPFVVVAAGDGPLLPALKTFIERQGLEDSFRLLGEVSLHRVAQLHNAADILLLPSLIEGIALAVFEAMALASVPVVSDVGGQRELVTPGCGYTIPLSDARDEILAYATALKQLIENPDQRREMAVDCRKRVQEHFKLEQMTTRFIAALDAAGSRHNSRIIWLPEAAVCREMATLAVDQVRLTILGRLSNERGRLLEGRSKQQEKIILKLQKQLEVIRSEIRAPEANELLY